MRDRKNEERFDEEDSEGEVAWRSAADGRPRDMAQPRPFYFLVRKAFEVSFASCGSGGGVGRGGVSL